MLFLLMILIIIVVVDDRVVGFLLEVMILNINVGVVLWLNVILVVILLVLEFIVSLYC